MNEFEILAEIDSVFLSKPAVSNNLNSLYHYTIKEKISQKTTADIEIDKATRKHLKELIKQSVLDYLDSNKAEKFIYRHYVFSMLSDQFRNCLFLSFEDIKWKEVLPLRM